MICGAALVESRFGWGKLPFGSGRLYGLLTGRAFNEQLKPMKLPQQLSEQQKNRPFAAPDSKTQDQKKARLLSIGSLFVFVACIILSFTGHALDFPIMHFLNTFSGKHSVLDCSLVFLADNNLTSGMTMIGRPSI